ncbi:hypothetical protein BCR32DRAFT_266130 [Anaeromyces robustus]|uniref:Uncharacterized protein n=1 Tax=Anaeromyces robustus TaxID=1754192 RepID=A0A1Y1XG40_9FUNG|nr:hypothetical protein BCR32DRAFT_266130 [Anaeromyces robustus]|eukprot:ORX84687.1 hypothetical protein BCR32DRAFT_266130 [Anaeromyces robustus]
MNNKKMKKIFLLILLLESINFSFSINEGTFRNVLGNNEKAMECFRNPKRADTAVDCRKVSKYMIALNDGVDVLNSDHAKNIMAAIKADSWEVPVLNFQDCAIDSKIFEATPPPQVHRIILSKNIALKESPINIPDNFISNLTSCPFQSDDNIKVNNCSAKLKNICSSNISCVVSKVNNQPVNPQPNNTPVLATSTTNLVTTSINNIITTPTNINSNDTINTNSTLINDKNNSTISNNESVNPINVENVDSPNNNNNNPDNSNHIKSLIQTFLLGLFTSFGILVLLLIILWFVQKNSKKSIVGLKKLTENHERKPLVKGEKSPSSSINDSTSTNDYGTQSTQSNYALSNSSQTSYSTQAKHKRYLYVFDDGSVMMSKSLNSNNLILQSNALSSQNSYTSPLNHNSIPTNFATISSNTNNIGVRSSLNSSNIPTLTRNSKLTISTTSNSNNINRSSLSPISPADSTTRLINNRNTISITIPQQTHTNHISSYTDKHSSGPYSAT